jgi:hypothetical protein
VALFVVGAATLAMPACAIATTYYVRQTVGDDHFDGLSPASAWRRVAKLSAAMRAGDTAYVGPGLYREQVTIMNDGAAAARIILVADSTGQHTGDPPGVVMLTGAEPVDESIFAPDQAPGVYRAAHPAYRVAGVVEMDGPQRRYRRARDTKEHLVEKLAEPEVVTRVPGSFHYDEATQVLLVHTSDGKPPATHEIELIRRGAGIGMTGKHYVTVMGFTFRHMGDAGVSIFRGSSDVAAIDNTSWGSRQGIRVYGAERVLIYGNTLLRNDNSGVYFAAESTNGSAIANVAYENVKGVRWSSQSVNALVLDNRLFENREAGIALEDADHALLRRNHLVRNAGAQLLVIRSAYSSEDNCFTSAAPSLAVDFVFGERYATLADYQRTRGQDLHSRAQGCTAPAKVDVRRLHTETTGYAERARRILASAKTISSPDPGKR